MTLPATDAFTGANDTNLTAYSANWSLNDGNFQIETNAISPEDGSECAARWSLDTWDPDQYSQITWLAVPNTYAAIGPALRLSTAGAATYYFWYADPTDEYYGRFNTGTYTEFSSRSRVVGVGDVMRLEIDGTSISAFIDGVLQFSGPQTDSSIASGAGGIAGYGTEDTCRGDDWGGGVLDAGGTEYTQSVSGSASGAGALSKRTNKALTASASGAGALVRRANKVLAASASGAGALVKQARRLLVGAASAAGNLSSALNLIAQYALEFYGDPGLSKFNSMTILLEDGVDQYPINMAGDQTVELKFRALAADNTATAADARYSHPLIDDDSWDDPWGRVLGLSRSGANLVLCFGVAGTSGDWDTIYGTTNVGDGEWHDVALTYNATTGAVVIWLNGVQEASGTFDAQDWSYPAGYVNPDGDRNNRRTFMMEKHGVGEMTIGAIDEIRFSNIVRYTSSYTPAARFEIDANTTGLYHLDEGSGTTSADATGNNPDAVLHVGGTPEGPVWISTATVFTQVLTATVSAAGAVAKQTQRAMAATTSGAGALVKETRKLFIGSSSAAGTLARATARTVSGTVTAGGTVVKQAQRAVSGTVTTGGAVIKQTQRTMAAAASGAGALVKQAARTLGGSLTGAGLLDASLNAGAFFVELMGGVTGTGALGRQTQRTIDGTASGAGALVKQVARGLAGSMTGAGALSASRLYTVIVAGAASAAVALVYGTDAEVIRAGTGSYYVDLAVTSAMVGKLVKYRWEATGAVQAANESEFRVAPSSFY